MHLYKFRLVLSHLMMPTVQENISCVVHCAWWICNYFVLISKLCLYRVYYVVRLYLILQSWKWTAFHLSVYYVGRTYTWLGVAPASRLLHKATNPGVIFSIFEKIRDITCSNHVALKPMTHVCLHTIHNQRKNGLIVVYIDWWSEDWQIKKSYNCFFVFTSFLLTRSVLLIKVYGELEYTWKSWTTVAHTLTQWNN